MKMFRNIVLLNIQKNQPTGAKLPYKFLNTPSNQKKNSEKTQ